MKCRADTRGCIYNIDKYNIVCHLWKGYKMKMYRVSLLPQGNNILTTIIGYFPHREEAERHIKYQLYDDFLYYFNPEKRQQIINNRYVIDEIDIDLLDNFGKR